MKFSMNLFFLCIVFSVGALSVTENITTEAYNETDVSEKENITTEAYNETDVSENVTETSTEEVAEKNIKQQFRMLTECATPNNDPGYCVELRQCPILLEQVKNSEAHDFLRASQCGPRNQDPRNPKVCCGKYNSFKNGKRDTLPESCGHQISEPILKIFGGKRTSLGEYPWVALLIHKSLYGFKTFGCTGFLIHVKYVVTAAHCTHPDSIKIKGPMISILFGEHDTRTLTDCTPDGSVCVNNTQNHQIAKVTTHPEYNPQDRNNYNDIAIIQLKKEAQLTDYIQPICLAEDDTDIPVSYYIAGFGRTEDSSKSRMKLYAEIRPFDRLQCVKRFESMNLVIKDTQICAGGQKLVDACSGDSGGPLMTNNGGTWYASGIVSYGVGCGEEGWPGVYTNIVKFLPWIKAQMVQQQGVKIATRTQSWNR